MTKNRNSYSKWFISKSPEDTKEIGYRIGESINPPFIIALCGDFGVGKTVLSQGIIAALGVGDEYISSPAYTLLNVYNSVKGFRVYHIDLYRIYCADDLEGAGIGEVLSDINGICIIEWWQPFQGYEKKDLHITLYFIDDLQRRIELRGEKAKIIG